MVDTAFPVFLPEPATTDEPFTRPSQTTRVRAICQIIVMGKDVTSFLNPHLVNVHIIDTTPSAEATIELDDRDGKLPLPPIGAPVSIRLGWRYESMHYGFRGQVIDLEHGFGRTQGGRRMWIHCSGADFLGETKTPKMNTEGEGAEPGQKEGKKVPFQGMFEKAMKSGGLTGQLHGSLNVMRDHFMQNNESALQYGQRMANEIGGIFRIQGKEASITVPGQNADGSSAGTIYAKWGDNLIGWRLHVFVSRDNNSSASQQSYDHQTGAWDFAKKQLNLMMNPPSGGGGAGQTGPAPNENVAGQNNDGKGADTKNNLGDGRIVINGEPRARWNMRAELSGARPGVDGSWRVFSVEHIYSREGFVTWLDVKPDFVPAAAGTTRANVGDGMQFYDTGGVTYMFTKKLSLTAEELAIGAEEI